MLDWAKRMATAVNTGFQTGIQAAVTAYKRGALSPSGTAYLSSLAALNWDSYDARLFRYYHLDLYYFNTVFSQLEPYVKQHLRYEGLYKYTRSLYNPVFRLVNITASKCYGGSLDFDTLTTGAVPMDGLDRRTEDALRQLWKWSNFGQLKMRYARYAARYGDGVLKVVDDPESGKVRLEVLHPGVIRDVDINSVGHVKAITIEYEKDDPLVPGDTCLYREYIDQDQFATYRVKNGQEELYAWNETAPNWDNPYGFVPVAMAQAADIGRQWGATTFHGGTIHKIDQLNDLAALVHDHMRQTVDAMWYLAGVDAVTDLRSDEVSLDTDDAETAADTNDEERSKIPVLNGPEGSQPYAMVANVDYTGALTAIDKLLLEIEKDCPELAFAKLREYRQDSAPAVRTILSDAIDRLTEFNGNLDAALVRAFQMACTIGGVGNYPGFEAFGLDDYDAGNLDFEIQERQIVLNELTKKERLEFFKETEAPPKWIWSELGKSEEEIAEAEADLEANSRAVAGEVGRALIAAQQQRNGNGNGSQSRTIPNNAGQNGGDPDANTEDQEH